MNIINLISTALGKGKQTCRLYFDRQYQTSAYEDAVRLANQNIGVIGVKECLKKLNADYEEYRQQRECLNHQEAQNEKGKYELWERVYKLKFYMKWAAIITFIFAMFVNPRNYILLGLQILLILGFVFGTVAFIVLKIMEWKRRREYQNYADNVFKKIEDINRTYLQKTDRIKLEIDNLYLSSLDPAHREVVLMRRDQERQHQEMVRLQQAYQREHENLLREQERTRRVQERLLEIEEERERRYNR